MGRQQEGWAVISWGKSRRDDEGRAGISWGENSGGNEGWVRISWGKRRNHDGGEQQDKEGIGAEDTEAVDDEADESDRGNLAEWDDFAWEGEAANDISRDHAAADAGDGTER